MIGRKDARKRREFSLLRNPTTTNTQNSHRQSNVCYDRIERFKPFKMFGPMLYGEARCVFYLFPNT